MKQRRTLHQPINPSNMLGKAAAVLGPLLVGVVAALTGNSRVGLLSILILFLSGMWFLRQVDDTREIAASHNH